MYTEVRNHAYSGLDVFVNSIYTDAASRRATYPPSNLLCSPRIKALAIPELIYSLTMIFSPKCAPAKISQFWLAHYRRHKDEFCIHGRRAWQPSPLYLGGFKYLSNATAF